MVTVAEALLALLAASGAADGTEGVKSVRGRLDGTESGAEASETMALAD